MYIQVFAVQNKTAYRASDPPVHYPNYHCLSDAFTTVMSVEVSE